MGTLKYVGYTVGLMVLFLFIRFGLALALGATQNMLPSNVVTGLFWLIQAAVVGIVFYYLWKYERVAAIVAIVVFFLSLGIGPMQ